MAISPRPKSLRKKPFIFISAFTLLEALIVILIIGILAGLSVPLYRSTIEKTRNNEAIAVLEVIRNAERLYYSRNGYFYPRNSGDSVTDIAAINANLGLDLEPDFDDDAGRDWDYRVEIPGGAWRALAERKNAPVAYARTLEIDFSGNVTIN